MNEWVKIFCIVAAVFAIATLIYVVGSIIKGIAKRSEEKHMQNNPPIRTERVLLITGLLCAASGMLIGHAIAKERDRKKDSKFPFRK